MMGLRKLHPRGGRVASRGVGREAGHGRRKKPPPAVEDDALALMRLAVRVKKPAHAVKGIIGADEPPPEARVSRLDECRLKQKVGYGQHANLLLLGWLGGGGA